MCLERISNFEAQGQEKFKQLLSNFEAQTQEKLSNLRLAEKPVAYKKNSSVYHWKGAETAKLLMVTLPYQIGVMLVLLFSENLLLCFWLIK